MHKVTDNILILVLLTMLGTFFLAASFIYFFVRYQRRMLQQKEAMQKAELDHQETLLHSVIQSQEAERKRIGRDLHDDVGSALSNLRMVFGKIVSDQNTPGNAEQYKPLIDNIINTVRNISHSLSPPGLELFGLEYTLHELCDNFNSAGVLHLTLTNHSGEKIDQLGPVPSLTLYRVIQELLSNTVKHAAATEADVCFTLEEGSMLVVYKDNGKGIDMSASKKPGMGMQNIESRLNMIEAPFVIESSPGNGFKIAIKIALQSIE